MLATGPFADTKEIEHDALLRSASLRWIWRLYTQRLTQGGRWFFWSSVIFTSYGSMSLYAQAYVPFCYAAMLWFVAFAATAVWKPRVRVQISHAPRVCAGERLQMNVEVEHFGRAPAMDLFMLPHRLPAEIDPFESPVPLPLLAAGQRAKANLELICNKRGVYKLKGVRVESEFPFGLMRANRNFEQATALTVYPKFTPLARLSIPSGRKHHPGGVALASPLGDSMEYLGNREYRDGDNIRNIDWRATARLNLPVVREYREEYFLRAAVILDTHVPDTKTWVTTFLGKQPPQGPHESFERAVSLCASVSDYMARQDYLVDIFAAGPNLYHLTAGRSLAYLDQILDILACVEEKPSEPFDIIEPEIMEHLSKINIVICVLLDWNETRRAFVENLRQQGAGLKVLIVRDSPCTLDPSADAELIGQAPIVSSQLFAAGIEEL